MRKVSAATFLLLGVLACDEPHTCAAIYRADKLIVTVRDARTKVPICDAQVFVGRSKSAERTELVVDGACVYADDVGLDDVYTVDVGHRSFRSVNREGIRPRRVDDDGCPRNIANVDIELER